MTTNLPPRFSEKQFRRYEQVIGFIVDRWPLVTELNPQSMGLTSETFSCRLRDAKTSLRNNQWDTKINMAKFVQCVDEIVISTSVRPGLVVAGPEDMLRKAAPLTSPIDTEQRDQQVIPTIRLLDPSLDMINAIMLLHHTGILIEPSRITTTMPLLTYNYLNRYDVSISKEGDVYTIV